MSTNTRIGVICGRWQPFHWGHQEYLLAAATVSDKILVGITNPDPSHFFTSDAASHRSAHSANPFSYFERLLMISSVARETGIESKLLGVIPFPLGNPNLLSAYVPGNATIYLTIYDDWGREKWRILQQAGWQTSVLWNRTDQDRLTSGSEIRARMRNGHSWQNLVPSGVARIIEELNLTARLRE